MPNTFESLCLQAHFVSVQITAVVEVHGGICHLAPVPLEGHCPIDHRAAVKAMEKRPRLSEQERLQGKHYKTLFLGRDPLPQSQSLRWKNQETHLLKRSRQHCSMLGSVLSKTDVLNTSTQSSGGTKSSPG